MSYRWLTNTLIYDSSGKSPFIFSGTDSLCWALNITPNCMHNSSSASCSHHARCLHEQSRSTCVRISLILQSFTDLYWLLVFMDKSIPARPWVPCDCSVSMHQIESVIQGRPVAEHLSSYGSRWMGQNVVQMTVWLDKKRENQTALEDY